MASRSSDIRFLRSAAPLMRSESASAPLPSEFRIFTAGENPSTKGSVVFDAAAASSVMRHHAEHGVDLMVDVEHGAVLGTCPDACAWAPRLELRRGDLWAVGVTWTLDGARRLRERTQRYISPAFTVDEGADGVVRVRELVNCAIVAMPATHGALPLVASRQTQTTRIAPDVRAGLQSLAGDAGSTTSAVIATRLESDWRTIDPATGLNQIELHHYREIKDPAHRERFLASRLRRRAEAERRSQPDPDCVVDPRDGLNAIQRHHLAEVRDPAARERVAARCRERNAKRK